MTKKKKKKKNRRGEHRSSGRCDQVREEQWGESGRMVQTGLDGRKISRDEIRGWRGDETRREEGGREGGKK